MTDTDTTADATTAETDATATAKTFSQDEVDKILADRLGRERAKYGDYADLKKRAASAMTEQEKAVAEAKQSGHAEAMAAASARLARAELRAEAAGQVDKATLDGFMAYADMSKFVGADGEPDTKAIVAAIKSLGGGRPADFDGGARTTADKPADMNALIRRQAGLG